MGNLSKIQEGTKEQANVLYNLPTQEDFEAKLRKVKDPKVLNELRLMTFQGNKDTYKKLVEKRIKSLGGSLTW